MKSTFVSPGELAGNTSTLFYLLCILEGDSPALDALLAGAVAGLNRDQSFPVEADDLIAVVCRVPKTVFGESELNELVSHLATLAPYAMRHEGAIRQLSEQSSALLPMAFGAVFEDIEHIRSRVHDNADLFHRQLDRIRGKEEWSLLVFRDMTQASDVAEQQSDRLRAMDAEIAAAQPGKAYLLRKQRERVLQTEADRIALEALQACMDKLAAQSVAVRMDEVPANTEAGTPIPVLKAAFLVDRSVVTQFNREVEAVRQAYEPIGFIIEVKGPWAPYSFVGEERVLA